MIDQDKPRICEVLGVEVGERFDLPAPNRYYSDCCVTADARVLAGAQKMGNGGLCWLYEHPDRIIRKPRFTEEERAAAHMFLDAYPSGRLVREDGGNLYLQFAGVRYRMPNLLFPSLCPDQSIALEEIAGD